MTPVHMTALNRLSILTGLALAVSACGGKPDRPELTPERMPPALKGITLLVSSEADVLHQMPAAKLVEPSVYEGKPVQRNVNGHPSDEIVSTQPDARFDSTPPGPAGKVFQLELAEPGVCDWVEANLAKLDGARSCPNNRKTGKSGDATHYKSYYCMTAGGHTITVDCTTQMPRATLDAGTQRPPVDVLEIRAIL